MPPIDVEKYRSIGAPVRKRGSHKYDNAPTKERMTDAVRSVKKKYGYKATRGVLERTVWAHSVGASSPTKFAELQQAGREEIQKIMDPHNNPNFKVGFRDTEDVKPAPTTNAEEAKRD